MSLRHFVIFKIGRFIPDRVWIQIKYRQWFGKFCNLKNPQTYNEKLQWLKLYDHRPEYTAMVDKYAAKQYVAERIGEEYVVPVVGGPWKHFDEIDFDRLPDQFVLKTTHDCGGVVICKDKAKLDKASAKDLLERHLKNNYYLTNREWPYKNVEPRIFAEQYLVDNDGSDQLSDYKMFCFDGVPKLLMIASDRQKAEETKFDFYDMQGQHLDLLNGHPNADVMPECPKNYKRMQELAAVLSKDYPHIRVDFYEHCGRLYLGELTLYHWSGMVPFKPASWDKTLGEWLNLPERKR